MVNRLVATLNDLAVTFDTAIRKAASPRIARALCNLRAEAEEKLRRAADGYGRRSPAEILEEVMDRLRDLVGSGSVMAIAKAASGPGRRQSGLTAPKPEGEALVAALVRIGKEFAELSAGIERVCKKHDAIPQFSAWRAYHVPALREMLRLRDLAGAEREMARARETAHALLDSIRIEAALPESKTLIPNFR